MNWDDVISIIKQLQSLKNNFPIDNKNTRYILSKRNCSYHEYTEMYSLVNEVLFVPISYIDIYVDINSIRIECYTGHLFVIDLNDYDIDQYTLTNGRPPQSIVISFNNIKEMFKDNKIELE